MAYKPIDKEATVNRFLEKAGISKSVTIGDYQMRVSALAMQPIGEETPTMYDVLFGMITCAHEDGVELIVPERSKC